MNNKLNRISGKPKPKAEVSTPPLVDEDKALKFITKGGSVAAREEEKTADEDQDEKIGLIVRMYKEEKEEVESFIRKLPKRERVSRNQWILTAIREKLDRDKKKI